MRKIKLIDKKFQLKIVFSALAVSLILSLLVLCGIFFVAIHNVETADEKLAGLESSIETQNNLFEAYVKYAESVGSHSFILDTAEMREDHLKSMEEVRTTTFYLQEIVERHNLLIILAVTAVIVHSIIFIIYLINITHRIAGPVYVMNKLVDDILAGNEAKLRTLRKGDYFNDLYQKIGQLKEKIDSKDLK